jgi:hypothetical protein
MGQKHLENPMNPMAMVLALLTTVGAAGILSGGRPRRVAEQEDEGAGTTDGTAGDGGTNTDGGMAPGDTPPPRAPAPPQTPIFREPVFAPTPPVQTGGDGSDGGSVAPTPLTGEPVAVITGRLTTLAPAGDDIASIRIVGQPEHGHVSVNPDNTLALVLTQTQATGSMSFSYEVTHTNGSTSMQTTKLDVSPGPQAAGWGTSENHYMLAVDANDRVIVEHGENHRKVFISNSDEALSLADIAEREGLAVRDITRNWLAARPHYGGSEDMALAPDAGMLAWSAANPRGIKSSNWLLFERGYTYGSGVDNLVKAFGESELHPLYVGAYGEGEKPLLTEQQRMPAGNHNNVVIRDLHVTGGFKVFDGKNIILEDMTFTGKEVTIEAFTQTNGVTIRNSSFYDIYREEPATPTDTEWFAHINRVSGLYMDDAKGVLLEGNFFDHNGWAPDYKVDGSLDGGQPPSMFSHNVYLQYTLDDVTFRDTISMRAASYGVQVRSGGFLEDNVFLDNNAAFSFLGGMFGGRGPTGTYSLATDNLVTSAAFRMAPQQGAFDWGFTSTGFLNSVVDNIVAHSADPNNPAELAAKGIHGEQKFNANDFYDDTIVWNWGNERSWGADQNVEGLDTAILNQTTIQIFTSQLLGKPDATIGDLANVLRAQAHGQLDMMVDADLILRFFQSGFGIAPDVRVEAGLLRFIPNDLGEGVRWDNRLNWSTQDLPGFAGLDSVDLGGNKVVFGGTVKVDELEFGSNGGLNVLHGKLTVEGGMETGAQGATLDIGEAGQVWTEGGRGTSKLDIDVTGGRFANTGDFRMHSDLTASGGQTLLGVDGATFAVTNGSRIEVVGGNAKVGFDGETGGMSILGLGREGTLAFTAKDGKLGTIEEFRSGAFEGDPNVLSGVDLGGGNLKIDLADLADISGSFSLLDVDELIGALKSPVITGLGARNAELVIDYANDSIALNLSAGSGSVSVSTVGNEGMFDAAEAALWNALTSGRGSYDTALPAEDDEEFLAVA